MRNVKDDIAGPGPNEGEIRARFVNTQMSARGYCAKQKTRKRKNKRARLGYGCRRRIRTADSKGMNLGCYHCIILRYWARTQGEEWYEPLSVVLGDGNAFLLNP